MKNKYYTPTLEEFYVGFEYEYLFGGTSWQTEIGNQDDILLAYSTYEEHPEEYNTHYRVKYLDQQDIESLGFQYYAINDKSYWGGTSIIYIYEGIKGNVFLYHVPNKGKIIIRQEEEQGETQLFEGTLKNKSELIKLLKQLGIEK